MAMKKLSASPSWFSRVEDLFFRIVCQSAAMLILS